MSFAPCIVIPCYNHGAAIGTVVARLAPHGLPIFIVDDGSNAETQRVLSALTEPQVRMITLPQNGGKGAAVMAGLHAAHAAGYSHALQIDADGQHDTSDVPTFLALSERHPHALISGLPVYDESVPKARRYGRHFSHVWVWIETLSFAMADSMCGFRLYPLAPTIALIEKVNISKRMNFDIEIAVRLMWRGMRVINLPTRVTYPLDGLSHFDMLRDNLRITATHTKLFFGMLWRLPLILLQRARPDTPTLHWSQIAERGSTWGLDFMALVHRLLGRAGARVLLVPIVAYFYLFNRRARDASRAYLTRLSTANGGMPSPSARNIFRHLYAFAESGLDKFAAWRSDIDPARIAFPNRDLFDDLMARKQGALFIGAHLGNLEMTRALAVENGLAQVNAVVYLEHAERFNAMLARHSQRFGVNLLPVREMGPDTAMMLKDKIDQGELIVIVGDRTPPAENGRVVYADFLGARAPFAQGPFILAHLLDCPVYLFFCLKEGDGYTIHLEAFADKITLPRRGRETAITEHAQRYAQRLEAYCQRAPLQWFNFYDFWRTEAGVATPISPTLPDMRMDQGT